MELAVCCQGTAATFVQAWGKVRASRVGWAAGAYTTPGGMGVNERFGLDPKAVGSHSGRELRNTGSFCRGTAIGGGWAQLGR